VAALAAVLPGVVVRVSGVGVAPVPRAALYGLAIVGASLLLAWAAEVSQLDISPALAIGGLALVAVLPEYVVGNVFAWRGGHAVSRYGSACQSAAARVAGHDSSCVLALANMLGANRLLIGIGWSLVVLIAWRRRRQRGERVRGVYLGREHCVELAFLALACGWCLTLPFRRSVTLLDAGVLFAVFLLYGLRVVGAPSDEPELEGVASWIGALASARARRSTAAGFTIIAAVVIFLCANAFADALVASGSVLGVDEFFLVQWLAPLASEAPELMIASIYAWRLRAATGLGALVSSKVNQWTVLVGSLPLTFAFASGTLHGLPLASGPREELALTAAQSVFGVAVLGNLEVTTAEAVAVFTLFLGELLGVALVPPGARAGVRIAFSVAYVGLGGAILLVKRHDTVALVRDGFRTPYAELGEPR
jgi:cation:H+ antiporter